MTAAATRRGSPAKDELMTDPNERAGEPQPEDAARDVTPQDEEPVAAEPAAHETHPDDAAHRRSEAQLQRAMADLANLRKRMQRDVEDARRRAIEALAAELLPVLDNFHLALGVKDQQEAGQGTFDAQAIVDGLRMVKSLLESVLERHGLSEIRADGADFDPNLHEAVGVDADSDAEPGRITQVMLPGYRLGDKVLRASRVIVRGDTDDAARGRRENGSAGS